MDEMHSDREEVVSEVSISSKAGELSLPWLYERRRLLIVLAALQIATSAGIIFGWSSLRVILYNTFYYSDEYLTLLFLLAQFANFSALPFSGAFLDRFGPRVSSAFFTGVVCVGVVLLGVGYALAGLVLLGLAGSGIQISMLHLGALFPNNPAQVMAMLSSCYQVSFTVFLLYKKLWEWSVSFKVLCFSHAVLLFAFAFVSLLIWPNTPVDLNKVRTLAGIEIEEKSAEDDPISSREATLPVRTISDKLLSWRFVCVSVWFAGSVFWSNLTVAVINEELKTFVEPSKMVMFIDAFNYSLPLGAIWSPFQGSIIDKLGFEAAIASATLLGAVVQLLMAFDNATVFFISFFPNAMARTALFATIYPYMSHHFGINHFGRMIGITFLCTGLIGLLQIPVSIRFRGHWKLLHITSFTTFIIMLLYPLLHFRIRRNQLKQQ